jgi:hypothetical protein
LVKPAEQAVALQPILGHLARQQLAHKRSAVTVAREHTSSSGGSWVCGDSSSCCCCRSSSTRIAAAALLAIVAAAAALRRQHCSDGNTAATADWGAAGSSRCATPLLLPLLQARAADAAALLRRGVVEV